MMKTMKMSHSFIMGALMVVATSCGITTEKKLEKAEEERRRVETKNSDLSDENATLRLRLQNVKVSDHYLWVVGGMGSSYDYAVKGCESLGYGLLNEQNLGEFTKQIYEKDEKIKSKVKLEDLHILGKTKELAAGWVFCAKERQVDAP